MKIPVETACNLTYKYIFSLIVIYKHRTFIHKNISLLIWLTITAIFHSKSWLARLKYMRSDYIIVVYKKRFCNFYFSANISSLNLRYNI